MKKINLLWVILFAGTLCSSAQNSGLLKVTLHKEKLIAPFNLPSDSTGVYFHSGLGTTTPTSAWQHIVGHWGIKDGLGQMTKLDSNTYTICIQLTDYYTRFASPDSLHGGEGLGPMPAGATPRNIGCVFREAGPCKLDAKGKPKCGSEGKDDAGKDIFINGLNDPANPTAPPYVTNQVGDPFDAVEAVYVNACAAGTNAIKDISSQLFTGIKTSPNPFENDVKIEFNMIPNVKEVSARLYDVMGRIVADFTPSISAGYNSFVYDGTGFNGETLPSGMYLLKVTNGSEVQTAKVVRK